MGKIEELERFDNVFWKVIFKHLTPETQNFIKYDFSKALEQERIKIKKNIGFLRQWLNEKPEDRLVTNKDIEEWLFNFRKESGE